MTNKPHNIFISYSRNDIEMMYKIRDALRVGGADVWTDEYITPYTKAWEEAIEQAIGNSSGMVVLCSPESKTSDWVNIELTWAKKKGLDIFLYLISGDEDKSIPFGYIRYQYTDARDDKQPQALKKLVDTIKERYGIIGIAELQEEIRALTAKYHSERQRVLDLQQELKEVQSNAHNTDDLLTQVTQSTTEIANLRAEIRTQKQRTRILQKSLDDLADAKQQEADALNAQLHTEQQRIIMLEHQLAQDTHPDVSALQAQLTQSVTEIEVLQTVKDDLTRQINTLDWKLRNAQRTGQITHQKRIKLFSQLIVSLVWLPFFILFIALALKFAPLASDGLQYTTVLISLIAITVIYIINIYSLEEDSLLLIFSSDDNEASLEFASIQSVFIFISLFWGSFIGGFIGGFCSDIVGKNISNLGGVFIDIGGFLGIFIGGVMLAVGLVIGIFVGITYGVIYCNLVKNGESYIAFLGASFVMLPLSNVIGLGIITGNWGQALLISIISGLIIFFIIIYLVKNGEWGYKVILISMPVMFAFLIWVYYFGGWRVFMPVAS